MLSVWFRSFSVSAPDQARVVAALKAAQVHAQEWPASESGDAAWGRVGLVLVGNPCNELCQSIARWTIEKGHRVLAITMPGCVMTDRQTWTLLDAGANDVLCWKTLADPAALIAARLQRWDEIDRVVNSPAVTENLVGRSRVWVGALQKIVETARFTDTSVLITGESGTGKEWAARMIHAVDQRTDKRDFAVLDCSTVVADLSGSEFFGHERGAFTSAVGAREGVFANADGGTLFLDEIGELPVTLQASLLRVIQERVYKPVGGNNWKRVRFRLVCATHKDLLEAQSHGGFRLDFYHRIAQSRCKLPALRERREDIPLLVDHFFKSMLPTGRAPEIDPLVTNYLRMRDYPGNVRELRHLVAQMAGRYVGHGPITIGHLPDDERPQIGLTIDEDWRSHLKTAMRHALMKGVTLREIGSGATQAAIEAALGDSEGNLQRAAKLLGVTDRALQMRRASLRAAERAETSDEPEEPTAVADDACGDGHT